MKRIRELEELLLRAEAAIAVALVLLMLALASYNVFYRNVLVPLQRHWAHSGPPVAATTAPPEEPIAEPDVPKADPPDRDAGEKAGGEGFAGDFGDEPAPADDKSGAEGFAGDFGDEPQPQADTKSPPPEPKAAGAGEAEGFAGDFGDEPEEKAAGEGFAGDFGDEPAGAPVQGEEGFAGDFGDPPDAKAAAEEDLSFDSEGDTPDDQFENLPMIEGAEDPALADDGPKGGPPPPGSFAAWAIVFIDKIKLDWIDVFLRQLVIIASFFGAMLATQRRKHITIDALSKILSPPTRRWVSAGINAVSIGVCFILASAGWDLVQIGKRYPKELVPWAEEWTFQLMFPVGFGLLAVHFGIRLLEGLTGTEPVEPTPAKTQATVVPGGELEPEPEPGPEPAGDASKEGER